MVIGQRLREFREQKKLSQGDVERRTGLHRCYISRVEHGITVPSIETLEKFARAFDLKMYQLVYDGPEPPKVMVLRNNRANKEWDIEGNDARFLNRLRNYLARMSDRDRAVLIAAASQMARQRSRGTEK